MKAQCHCRDGWGSCCVACRAALELAAIAARLLDRAPDMANRVQALAIQLQRELAEDRRVKKEVGVLVG